MLRSRFVLLLVLSAVCCTDLTYYIKEGKSPGTLVGDIAVDAHLKGYPSPGTHSNLQFNLKQQDPTNGSEYFTLSPINKKLYTQKTIDAETVCTRNVECYLIVDMEILQAGSLLQILRLKVVIEDVNDNDPEFLENKINLQFSEKDSIGTRRPIPTAIDRDVSVPNSQITYQLKRNSDDPFALSSSYLEDGNSELNIYLEEKLDREAKASYKVQVIAKDQGNPPKQSALDVSITVNDWNDNLPEFSQNIYNVTISYDENRNLPIAVVTATDLDKGKSGKITYRISSQTSKTAKSFFRINRETGEIFLQKELDLNQSALYKLFVKATDGGRLRHTTLSIVNVNVVGSKNNAPNIEVNFISGSTKNMAVISEAAEIGSFIAYVKVTDDDPGDNGEVICDLRHSHFQLQNMGVQKYKVTVRNLIDRETRDLYEITIVCQDKGSPPLQSKQKLSVRISDVNDVRPTFSQKTYTFQIYENQKSQIPIGFINATDPDLGAGGEVTYSLLKNPKTFLPFRIANGAIIIATRSLDRESKDHYRFKVLAKDNGTPSLNNTATVLVRVLDENDNAPRFTFPDVNPFHLDIFYQAHQRNITTLKAVDMDAKENTHLSFKIINSDYRSLFALDRHSGQLFFSRPLSANDSRTYKLLLLVKDSGIPSLSSTTNLTLALVVEAGDVRTLTAVKITKDFSLAKNAQMVTALLATVGSLSLAILILILVLKMHHLKAVCCNRGGALSSGNGGSGENLGKSTKKATSWGDISLDLKMNPCVSEETLPRKSEDETETDDKKEIFTSDENLHTTSEYDDPVTLIETDLPDSSDESNWAKSTDNSGLVLAMSPPFDGSDEEVGSNGKFKKMRQVLNPNYYTSQCLIPTISRMGQPQNRDKNTSRHPGDNTDIPQQHKAMVHDDFCHPEDITLRSQKQYSHSKLLNRPIKKKQIPAHKQQSKIPCLPRLRNPALENYPNDGKQSTQTPQQKLKLNMPRSMSEQSSISLQNSFSDETGLMPTQKTIGSVKQHEKPVPVESLPRYQQELLPPKAPPDKKIKRPDTEASISYQYSIKSAPIFERPPAQTQSQLLSPRRSPSQIPLPKQIPENFSNLTPAKTFQPDTQQLTDSDDNMRIPKSSMKLFQSKIPMPFPRMQAPSKLTPTNSENTSDQLEKSCLPAPYMPNQEEFMDDMQRAKCDNVSKRLRLQPNLISQENKNLSCPATEQPTSYPEWYTQLQKSENAKESSRMEYPENFKLPKNFANAENRQPSRGIKKHFNSLNQSQV